MRLLTEKILNNLYRSPLEEDFLSLLTQEEEDYSQVYPETEDIYIEIAKSKIHKDLEFLFTFEMSVEERLFLSSLIIQLALRSPQFIVFYNTPNSLYDDIDTLINSTETIKANWYDYSSETGSGDFLDFAGNILENPDISEDTKDSFKYFAPYVSLDYFYAFHLTSRPYLEGSQVYNQEERPAIFIWIPSDPEFKLVVEFLNAYTPIYLDEVDIKDDILKSEGFQIIQFDEIEVTLNPIEKAKELYEHLIACSKQRKENQNNRKDPNIRRTSTQRINLTEKKSLEESHHYFGDGKYLEALASYQKVAQLNPNNHLAHLGMAYTLQRLERYTDALEAFDNAIRIVPFDVLAQKNKGMILLNLNRYAEALETFSEVINYQPNDPTALYGMGRSLFLMGNYSEALDTFKQVIQFEPNNAYVHANMGEVLFILNEYEEALAAINQAMNLDPYNADFYNKRGEIFFNLRRYIEALGDYEQAIRLYSKYSTAYYNKGIVLLELEQYLEALSAFEEAIYLDPNYVLAYKGKGDALVKLNRHLEAMAAFGESLLFQVLGDILPTNQ